MTTKFNTNAKVKMAADYIQASKAADGNGWIYRADETGEWFRLTERDLLDLCDLLYSDDEDTRRDAYSLWCSDAGELIGDDSAAQAAGLID